MVQHADLTSQAKRVAKRGCLGCAVVLVLPLLLLAALLVPIVVGDDQASAANGGITGVNCAPTGSTHGRVARIDAEQLRNAATIVRVGTQMKVGERGHVIALMAAITESGLRNLNYGDRDSLGLFQMRPSQNWGTPAQVTDPVYASRKFYTVMLDVPRWKTRPLGDVAQAVEQSGHPHRYATHEQEARQVLGAVQGVLCDETGGGGSGGGVPLPDEPKARKVVQAALSQVGVRYAWGGGDPSGPTEGFGVDKGVVGFDCSGLALYAYAKIGVAVPHQTQAIWASFQPAITDPDEVRPADLILLSSNGRPGGIHHVGIYLGAGKVVHAPQSGQRVRVDRIIWQSNYWSKEFIGAVRPGVG